MKKIVLDILFISSFCIILLGFGIQRIGLTDPDETFYAETAKEMLQHHSFFTPLIFEKPQFEKPPLTYWLIMASFSLFGTNETSARIPVVIFALMGIIATYIFSLLIFNRKIAVFSAWILITSFLYLGLSCAVLTDMIFTVLIALSLYCFFLGYSKTQHQRIFWNFFYIFMALAVLTKGPLAIIIIGLTVMTFVLLNKKIYILKKLIYTQGLTIFLIVSLPWYLIMMSKYGRFFFSEFFIHENINRFFIAEHIHNDHLYYYPLMIFVNIFPWSFWLFLLKRKINNSSLEFSFLKSWFWLPLIFLTFAKSKLPTYILPLFPPLAILLGTSIAGLKESVKTIRTRIITLLSILFLTFAFFAGEKLHQQFPDVYTILFLLLMGFSLIYFLSLVYLWFAKYRAAFILNILAVTFLASGCAYFLLPKLEGNFSNKGLNNIISRYRNSDKTIVCDKLFVRGVYYYTHRPVAVLSYERHPFYTPHPLKIIVTDKEVKDFFSEKNITICVIKKDELERLNQVFKNKRANTIIEKHGNRFIILSKKIR